jgi:hypothetical protein
MIKHGQNNARGAHSIELTRRPLIPAHAGIQIAELQ